MNINVSAVRHADGDVRCHVECDGQEATVIFTGTEVLVEVQEPARPGGAFLGAAAGAGPS